eukprot:374441_1
MYYANLKTKESRWIPPPPPAPPTKPAPLNITTPIANQYENENDYNSDNDVLIESEYITPVTPETPNDTKLDTTYLETTNESEDENIENIENTNTDLLNEMETMDDVIMNQLLQFGYSKSQIISALQMVQYKHIIYDINHVLEQIQCDNQKFCIEEYVVTFDSRPFGMELSTKKSDKNNLYVRKVKLHSIAWKEHVIVGSQLIEFNGTNIEGIGAINIFKHMKEAKLPLHIMFRKKRN